MAQFYSLLLWSCYPNMSIRLDKRRKGSSDAEEPNTFQKSKCYLLGRFHVGDQVENLYGVTPLVIVPGNNLHEIVGE